MCAELSNFSLLKYYNKSLLELNSYSKNSPIIYKSGNFINYYLCNDLIVSIHSDYLNGINIPSIGYLNTLLTKWWYEKLPFIKLNILNVENNLIISNKLNTINIKFLIFSNKNNLKYILKKISQIKQTDITFNKNIEEYKYKNNFIIAFDNKWTLVDQIHDNKYVDYCKTFTDNIYSKGVNICKKNNINLDSSIFLFGNNNTNKLFIINNPFNFDNSIYNLHEYYNLSEDKSKILKYFKNIINSISGTKDYLVSIHKNININREIYKYYMKHSNIFLINSNIQDNKLNLLKQNFDDNNLFYILTDDVNKSLLQYYKINKSIILILLIENKKQIDNIDNLNLPCIIYSKNEYQNVDISNYIFVDSIDQILELCLKINLNKIM